MSAPTVVSTAVHGSDGGGATRSVDLPATIASGNLLLMQLRASITGGSNVTITVPTGWSNLGSRNSGGTTYWIGRVADGDEGATVSITISENGGLSANAYQITNWGGALSGVFVEFHSANENIPPLLNHAQGSRHTLWLAGITARRTDWDITADPANYSDRLSQRSSPFESNNLGRTTTASARRTLTAESEQPGAWTLSGTPDAIHVSTVAVLSPPSSFGIRITDIKEPNEANTLVASVASPRIKVWRGTDDSGAEDDLLGEDETDYPITNGILEVPLPTYFVDDVVTVEVMWTVGTERKLFVKETTVVDLGA